MRPRRSRRLRLPGCARPTPLWPPRWPTGDRAMASPDPRRALLRWRLVLGPPDGAGGGPGAALWADAQVALGQDADLAGLDQALDFLYGGERTGALAASMPYVPTWL